jgi:hypothetical protein
VEGSGPHPRGKVAHHLRWTKDGKAQLDAPRPQEGKAPQIALGALSRRPLAVVHPQPMSSTNGELSLSLSLSVHISGPVGLHEFTFEEGHLVDKALGISVGVS